jgi:hypothetical protein
MTLRSRLESAAALLALTGLLVVPAAAHGPGTGWSYPPACCKGDPVTGDCHRIPGAAVRAGPDGYVVVLGPGDHPKVTRRERYLVPYGSTIPSGDGAFHICLHPTEHDANCFFAPPGDV